MSSWPLSQNASSSSILPSILLPNIGLSPLAERRVFIETSDDESDYCLNLLGLKPIEPFHKIVDFGPCLKIRKHRLHRHVCPLEDPGLAHLARNAFNSVECDQSRFAMTRTPFSKSIRKLARFNSPHTTVISCPRASRPASASPARASATAITVTASTAG